MMCLVSNQKILTVYRIGPRSALWKFGYDPANTVGGEKRGDMDTLLFPGDMVPLLDEVWHIILYYVYIVCEI